MWDAIGGILKLIFEKYLVPAILAVPITVLLYVILPDNNFIQNKVGNKVYAGFIFAIVLLIVLFIIWTYKKICKLRQLSIERRYYEKKAFERLWLDVDGLRDEERLLVDQLFENGNEPVVMLQPYYMDRLRDFVEYEPVKSSLNCFQSSNYYKFILKEDIYKLMKKSKEKYGRISHFKD